VSNQSASGTAARGEPASGPVLSVSLGLWQDRPAAEVVRTAEVADALGYGEIWIGEMATFDAFALGAVVAGRTARAALTIGPLAVAVRDPVMIAMGAGSLAELTGRTVNVALGSSSPVVVEQWHGRRQERTALALAESATAVRALLAGGKADVRGEVISTRGFRLRTRAPATPLTIAAFGHGAVTCVASASPRSSCPSGSSCGTNCPATRSARSASANCGTNCAIDERVLIQ
jgi:probable F420-dependent oxidoreductase